MRSTIAGLVVVTRVAGAEPVMKLPDLMIERDLDAGSDTTSDTVGWHIESRLARKLGHGLELHMTGEADATQANLDLSIAKVFQLADGNTAWISLGIAVRSWLDEPSEADVMVRAGFSFR
ncbi:MAG TPA: hypothetical protein VGG74_36800 [Kofleriaceae bacterium]|jgi:hypothetical protein